MDKKLILFYIDEKIPTIIIKKNYLPENLFINKLKITIIKTYFLIPEIETIFFSNINEMNQNLKKQNYNLSIMFFNFLSGFYLKIHLSLYLSFYPLSVCVSFYLCSVNYFITL